MAQTEVGRAREPAAPPAPEPAAPEAAAPHLTYRPGLDGLRAVAVLAVMVQHAGLHIPGGRGLALPGGFLGVDVFFVISGFLITSLLLAEHRRDGGIALRRFWLRRARRLLPAVALAVAGTCLLITLADLPLDVPSARGDALASLGYVANWRFVLTRQSYFDSFGLPSPFRHLWSLAVEEQWYLLFPPVLALALAWRPLRRRPGLLMAGLLAAGALSAARMAALYHPGDDPSRVYYGTDTRAFTLLAGAALAAAAAAHPRAVARLRPLLPVLAGAGLAALAVDFRVYDGHEATLYRGGLGGVALASAAVVAGVALPGASGPVHWLLSRRVPVAVGIISYGLYLWHWPIFVWLTPERAGFHGLRLTALRFGLTFAVAVLSYRLVERPIRRHGWAGLRARLARAGVPAAPPAALSAVAGAVVVAVVAVSTVGGGASPALAIHNSMTTLGPIDFPVSTVPVAPGRTLPTVPRWRPLRVVIGGDSVAWSITLGLTEGKQTPRDVDMLTVANLGCTASPGDVLDASGVVRRSLCKDWQREWQAAAASYRADVVVALWGPWEVFDHKVGGRVRHAGTPAAGAAYRAALRSGIDATVAASPDVRFALLTVPCMHDHDVALGGAASPRNDPALLAWINRESAAVAAGYGGRVMMIDLGPLVCPGGRFAERVDGVVARRDGIHFTTQFAPMVWDYIAARLRPWLARPVVSGPR
jgi:peptidoglycan/LPS O-acetylase OafA/YrhL